MHTPKRSHNAADQPHSSTTLAERRASTSTAPRPHKRAKPNNSATNSLRRRLNGFLSSSSTATESTDRTLEWRPSPLFSTKNSPPLIPSSPTVQEDDSDKADPEDAPPTQQQIIEEIRNLQQKQRHLRERYTGEVINAHRSNRPKPAEPLELAELSHQIKNLRKLLSAASTSMEPRANGTEGADVRSSGLTGMDSKGKSKYVRKKPMGQNQPRPAPSSSASTSLPLHVLAHPSPLLPRPPDPPMEIERPVRAPSPSPPPMGPSATPRPPWAPTWDPASDAEPTSRPNLKTLATARPKKVREKVKNRDRSDIECLATAQPDLAALDSPLSGLAKYSFLQETEEDDKPAPEADETNHMLDFYKQAVFEGMKPGQSKAAALDSSSTSTPANRSHRNGHQRTLAADLVGPSSLDQPRGHYSPNNVKGTSASYGTSQAALPGKPLLFTTTKTRNLANGSGDQVSKLTKAINNYLSIAEIAEKSRREWTMDKYERWEATQAKIKAANEEAERRVLELSKVKEVKKRQFPAKLSKEHSKVVQGIFSNRNYETSIKGATAAFRDMNRLNGEDWLNDELINYYGVMINARSDAADAREKAKEPDPRGLGEEKLLKAFCFNTNFYTMFSESGFAKVKRWTRRFNTFEKDIIIIPINHNNMHWCCSAVNLREKRFEYYDSLGSPREFVYKTLRKWLQEEHKSRKGTEIDLSDWENYWDKNVPKQNNINDCGVFTCMFMESLSRDCAGFDFQQKNMPYLRRRIALEIDNGELMNLEEYA
ncbi:hypothetical protein JCM10908_002803 [Rhodotorula pacifica]|uniref:uncharacterized protein n=1 Tax=Rhodotorula pacifica TaxID=1495444 RepID=UPI00317D8659